MMIEKLKTLRGAGGGGKSGGSSGSASEAPNTLDSGSTASILDLISEGEILGLVNGDQSRFINGVSLQNPDGSYNFLGVTTAIQVGTPDQDYIPGFPDVENEVAVGLQFRHDTPVVQTITDPNTNRALVKIQIPALTYTSTSGSIGATGVEFQIWLQSNGGGYVLQTDKNIFGKTTSAYQCQYNVNLPAGGSPWDIKLVRVSADNPSLQLSNETWWASYTEIIDQKIQYADSAVVGTTINATQFGNSIPTRTFEIYGILLQIPSNYNPTTRVYTGIWDGTFKTAWSDNPAWVLYDLLTNSRYGVGSAVNAVSVDKFSLYTIAQYCDGLVPDGEGGVEPRFTFNGVINSVSDAYTVLKYIASNFRGMIYWASGLITATQDSPASISKLVSPANVIGGLFTYTGVSAKARFSVAVVSWWNPNDTYNQDVIAYEDPELLQIMGWKPQNLTAYGCTSRGQAYRYAKWYLDTQKYSTEVVVFRVSFDNADLLPGDVVGVSDPTYAGVRYGGRLVYSAVGTPLLDPSGNPILDPQGNPILDTGTPVYTLDAAVVLEVGQTYTLSCVMPDGSIQTEAITNPSDGTAQSIMTLVTPFSQNPVPGAMWTITASDISPRQFRVVGIKETAKNIWEITAVYYDPTKYARVEEDVTLTPPNFSLIPTGPLLPPSALSAVDYLYTTSGGIVAAEIALSWTPSPDPRVGSYQIQMSVPGSGFWENANPSVSYTPSVNLTGLAEGVYNFQVRAVSLIGTVSPWAFLSFNYLGLSAPPSDVTFFSVNNTGAQSTLTWDAVTDLDLAYYIIKYSPQITGATWGSATVLVANVPPSATSATVPTLIGTYLIAAVTASGVQSVNADLIVSNIGDLTQTNLIDTIEEDPTFGGVSTNCIVSSSQLSLTSALSPGTYTFAGSLDMGAIFTARVIPSVTAEGQLSSDDMSSWSTLSSVTVMDPSSPSEWNVGVQIRTTNNAPWVDASNLIAYPSTITDASWTKTHATAASGTVAAPDGNTTGATLTEDSTASTTHGLTQSQAFTSTDVYTLSVYAKAGTRSFIELMLPSAQFSSNPSCFFDLTAGVAGTPTGCTAVCTAVGNGWFRCSITATATATSSGSLSILMATSISVSSYSGGGVDLLYLWQAQLTQAAAAYSPTWGVWQDCVIGSYTCRAMQFQAILTSNDGITTPLISALAVEIDIPSRSTGAADVTTNGSGVSVITYTNAFFASPYVTIAGHNMATGDYWTITSKSATGFTITFYNAAGSPVVRTFDWNSTGFGNLIP